MSTKVGYTQAPQGLFSATAGKSQGAPVAGANETDDPLGSAAVAAALNGLLPTPNIGLFGDSITSNNGGPGSVPTKTKDNGFFTHANALAGSPCNVVINAGIAGNTTTQMLARIDTDLLSYSLSACTIMGGTNDLGGTYTVAGIISNLRAMYQKCIAKSVYVFALAILPRPTLGAQAQKDLITINEWIKQYWAGSPFGEFVDTFAAIVDPTSSSQAVIANALNTVDNTHPSNVGAYLIGKVLATRLTARFSPFARKLISSAQDCYQNNTQSTNGMRPFNLTSGGTTAGTVTGNIANGYSATSTVNSCVGSLAARADGFGNDQVFTMTATGAQTLDFYQGGNLIGAPFAVGDQVVFECVVSVDAGDSNLSRIGMYTYSGSGGSGYPSAMDAGSTNYAYPSGAKTWTIVSPVVTIPPGVTDLGAYVHAEFSAAGNATVRIGRISFRKQLPNY